MYFYILIQELLISKYIIFMKLKFGFSLWLLLMDLERIVPC